jgi:hypothetical protein
MPPNIFRSFCSRAQPQSKGATMGPAQISEGPMTVAASAKTKLSGGEGPSS